MIITTGSGRVYDTERLLVRLDITPDNGSTLYGLTPHAIARNSWKSEYGYHYAQDAIDEYGNEYLITWDVINPQAAQDEDACDWDNYKITREQ